MKRFACLAALCAVLAISSPAGANMVPDLAVSCDAVSFTWTDFPDRPVDLTVTVDFGDERTTALVSTDGAPEGTASIPLAMEGSGTAHAIVSWTLQRDHSAETSAELECETVETTTTTTSPETTISTVPATTATSGPSTTGTTPEDCSDRTLACTGSGDSTGALVAGGLGLVGIGGLLAGTRARRRSVG